MEYEISDQPQENYRPERVAMQPEQVDQHGELASNTDGQPELAIW